MGTQDTTTKPPVDTTAPAPAASTDSTTGAPSADSTADDKPNLGDKAINALGSIVTSLDMTPQDISVGVKTIALNTEIRVGEGNGVEAFVRRNNVNIAGFKGSVDVGLQNDMVGFHPLGASSSSYLLKTDSYIRSSETGSRPSVSYTGTRTVGSDTLAVSASVGTNGVNTGLELSSPLKTLDRTQDQGGVRDVNLVTGVDVAVNKNGAGVSAYGGVTYRDSSVTASVQAQVQVGARSFGSRDDIVAAVRGDVVYDSKKGLSGYFTGQASTRGFNLEAGVATTKPVVTVAGLPLVATAGVGYDTRGVDTGRDGLGVRAGVGGGAYVTGGFKATF